MLAQNLDSVPMDSNEENFKAYQESRLVYWAEKMLPAIKQRRNESTKAFERRKSKLSPIIGLVPLKCIHSTCIGIPDDILGDQNTPHAFLFIKSLTTWKKTFEEFIADKQKE